MKHMFLVFSLLALCIHYTIFPMNAIKTTISQADLATIIDNEINKQYSAHHYLSDVTNIFTSRFISEEEMYNIIGIVVRHGEELSYALLDDLYAKNVFFSKTVDHFTILAQDNLHTVSAQNLKIIENPTKYQPVSQLNKLTVFIRKYIMQKALDTINYTYDIPLRGHKENIQAFDICQATDQAVTASICSPYNPDNNSLYLWSLKTGRFERLAERRPISLLAFSPDGKYIAAALSDINVIHIWCPKTKQILLTLNTQYKVESMQYTQPINHTLVTIHNYPNHLRPIIQQWILTPHTVQAGEHVGYITDLIKQHNYFANTVYTACLEMRAFHSKNNLYVTKKSIPLYLCAQAINNSRNMENIRNSIEQSSSYHALTDLEKPMIIEEIRKRTAEFKAIPQRPITQQPLLHLNN